MQYETEWDWLYDLAQRHVTRWMDDAALNAHIEAATDGHLRQVIKTGQWLASLDIERVTDWMLLYFVAADREYTRRHRKDMVVAPPQEMESF